MGSSSTRQGQSSDRVVLPIDPTKCPPYVLPEIAQKLIWTCGRQNPRLYRAIFDLRTKSAWSDLGEILDRPKSIAHFVRATVIVAQDYSMSLLAPRERLE